MRLKVTSGVLFCSWKVFVYIRTNLEDGGTSRQIHDLRNGVFCFIMEGNINITFLKGHSKRGFKRCMKMKMSLFVLSFEFIHIINFLQRYILIQNRTFFSSFATIIICACFILESLVFGYWRLFLYSTSALSISFHYGH